MKTQLSKLLTVVILLVTATACTQTNSYSSKIHVTKLVPADVFEVLPESEMEMKVYNGSDEIPGEYFELAMIEIEETSNTKATESIVDSLKREVKELGGNGMLIVQDTSTENGKSQSQKMKVIAIYALTQMQTGPHTLVSL